MTESLGQLWINLGVKSTVKSDLSGVTSQISAVNTVSSGASSGLGKLKTAAVAVTAAVGTAGLVAGTKKAVGMFQDFEKSVSNAASVTGKTGEAFEQAKKNISAVAQELGQATAFSSSQAADAMYNLASAGYDVSTMSANDLTPMLNLAAATQYDLAETTSTTASTLSQFGLGFESAGRVADVFTSVIGKSQANMEKLSYSMKYVGTIANTAGMGIEETSAALGTLYNAGLDGSSAGTGLRGVLASLIKPSENAGSALQAMGLEMEDINPVTHGFSNVMKTLADHGLDAEKAFWLFGREAAPAALAMASNSDGLKQLTTELQNAGGTAQTVADEQLDTLAGSLDSLSGSIENMMINIGQALAPTIRQIADALVPMVPAVQDFVIGIVNTFVTFVSQLGGSVSSIKAIGGTIYDVFSSVFQAVAGTGSSVASSAADVINGIMQQIAGVITGAAPLIQSILVNVVTFIKSIITGLGPTWENLKGIAQNVGNIFKTLFTNISSAASPGIANTISGVINTITLALSMFSDVVAWAVSAVVPKVKGLFSGILSTVQGIMPSFSTVWEDLGLLFEQLPYIIEDTVAKLEPIWDGLVSLFNTGKTIVTDFVSNLGPTWENLGYIFDAGSRLLSGALQTASEAFGTLFNSLSNSVDVGSIGESIANAFNIISGAIADFMMALAENGGISGALENAFDIDLSSVWGGIESAFNTGINIIKGFIDDLSPSWDNLKTSFESIIEIIGVVAPDILDFFGSFSGPESSTMISAGSIIAGVINVLTGAVADFLKYLADNPKIVELGLAIGGVVAAFAVLTPVISGVIGFFGSLYAALYPVGYIIGYLAGTVLPILITPLGLIGIAVAALALAWSTNWMGIRDKAKAVWDTLKTTATNLSNKLSLTWHGLIMAVGQLKTNMSTIWNLVVDVIKTDAGLIVSSVHGLYQKLVSAYNSIVTSLSTLKTQVLAKWTEIKNSILIKLNGIITDIQNWVVKQKARYNQAIMDINYHKTQVLAKWAAIKAGILTKLNGLINDAQNWVAKQKEKFNQAIASISNFKNQVLAKWTEIKAGILAKFNGIISDAQNWVSRQKEKFNQAVSAVQDLKTRFIAGFQDILTRVKTKASDIVGAVAEIPTKVKNKATEFYNAGKDVVQKLIDGLLAKLQTVKDTVSKITSAASLSGLSSSVSKSTSSLGSSLSSSIKSAGSSAKVSLAAAATGLKRLLPNSPAKEGPFKTLPNWDAIFLDPLQNSIAKMSGLKSTLSDSLTGLSSQITPSSMTQTSTSSISNSYAGDTISIQVGTINSQADVDYLIKQIEARSKRKGFQMGVLR